LWTGAVVAGCLCAFAAASEARNPHCAGGIQYVTQAMNDKAKGNMDDYRREISKAVQQLETCANEDTNDAEAVGYLGRAYAEVDSSAAAGRAFALAMRRLHDKDPKKEQWVKDYRDSYWTLAFNDAIDKINKARIAYADFGKEPANDGEKQAKAEATKRYDEAIASLTRASHLRPNDPRTLHNLGIVYGFQSQYETAERWLGEAHRAAPGDTDISNTLRATQSRRAGQLLDEKKYDDAIAYYTKLLKDEPKNVGELSGLGDAYFKKAQAQEGDARKPDFKAAGEAYAKAFAVQSDDADMAFNSALSYQSAGEYALSVPQWQNVLKLRPTDPDASSSLGSCLAELGKFDEATKVLHTALLSDPKNAKNKTLHRQLGAVYTKAGNNAKATEELMVYLALQNGKPVADAGAEAAKAPPASVAAKTLASSGKPDEIFAWDAESQKYQTWFYWSKGTAYHFQGGSLVQKSDWGSSDKGSGAK
jgi:tetratricopeptide (TPR) repeat protein